MWEMLTSAILKDTVIHFKAICQFEMQSQLYLYIITSGQVCDTVGIFSKSLEAVSIWVGSKKLNLNLSKTDLLLDDCDFQSLEKESCCL